MSAKCCKDDREDGRKVLVSYTVLDGARQNGALKYIAAIPGAHGKVDNPRDAKAPIPWKLPNPANFSYVYRNETRMLLAKITSEEGVIPSSCVYSLLTLPHKPREGWPALSDNVMLQDSADPPLPLATNPQGLAQVGDWLYIIDFDSQKITILGTNELNGLPPGPHTPEQDPFDLGPDGQDVLYDMAKGRSIIALRDNGTDYLFAVYNDYDGSGPCTVVRMTVNEDGTLNLIDTFFWKQFTNGQGLVPVIADNGYLILLMSMVGGEHAPGQTNQENSKLVKFENIFDTAGQMPWADVITGDMTPTPAGAQPTWDISCFAAARRPGGVAYLLAYMFNDTSTSVNYTIYKTTVSKLLAIQSTITLWEAYQEGILEIAEEGAVTSSAPSPSGINFFDLFIAMGDNPEDDELYAFIGSQLKICSALHYGARALVFGLGYEEGQLGGVNVNRADLTTKTERQAETGAP